MAAVLPESSRGAELVNYEVPFFSSSASSAACPPLLGGTLATEHVWGFSPRRGHGPLRSCHTSMPREGSHRDQQGPARGREQSLSCYPARARRRVCFRRTVAVCRGQLAHSNKHCLSRCRPALPGWFTEHDIGRRGEGEGETERGRKRGERGGAVQTPPASRAASKRTTDNGKRKTENGLACLGHSGGENPQPCRNRAPPGWAYSLFAPPPLSPLSTDYGVRNAREALAKHFLDSGQRTEWTEENGLSGTTDGG